MSNFLRRIPHRWQIRLATAALIAFAMVGVAVTQPAPVGHIGAPTAASALVTPSFCAYKDINYGGTAWCYGGTFNCYSLSGTTAFNQWSSIKTFNYKQWNGTYYVGYKVTLYNHADCTDWLGAFGPYACAGCSAWPDFRTYSTGINDQASAFIVQKVAG